MENLISEFVHNQLSRAPILLQNYIKDEQGNSYLTRSIFIRVEKYLNEFLNRGQEIRLIAIPGLRGVGKTTLLAQLYMKLLKNDAANLFFISVDQIVNILDSNLSAVLEEYEKFLGTSFEGLTKKTIIFIDEIHFDKKWPSVLKSLYDRAKNIFVVCTGSSALSLQSTPDLARRMIIEKLYPLNFTEYMLLKSKYLASANQYRKTKYPIFGLKDKIKSALFYQNDAVSSFEILKSLQNEVDNYWSNIDKLEISSFLRFGTMPYALKINDEQKLHVLTNQLIDKVATKDLLEYANFEVETIEFVKNIMLLLSGSSEISITRLTKTISNISTNTLINIFEALEKAEILIRVYPYGNVYRKVRKPSKYHFMTPAIRHALLTIVEGERTFENNKGKYLEDIVALILYREFKERLTSPIFYDSSQGGADFILKLNKTKIALEIGFGEKGVKQAGFTLQNIGGTYGLVISDDPLDIVNNIIKVPLQYFLLM